MRDSLDRSLATGVERVEAEAWAELQGCLPVALRTQFGITVERRHGGVILVAAGSPVPGINRAIGIGIDAPFTENDLDELIADYRSANVARFVVQWSPVAQFYEASEMFDERGFRLVSHVAKMVRGVGEPLPEPTEPSPLSIREVGAKDAALFEQIVAGPLGAPDGLEAGVRSTVGQPRWRHYLALDGDEPVAGAALYLGGEHAWCGLGATAEAARGRGAQTALLRRRIADAKAAGCKWISADALVGKLPGPVQSRRNLERLGFATLYERPNYLLDLGTPPAVPA